MTTPTKITVRRWLKNRAKDHKPLPTQEELRRQLGWELIKRNHGG